EEAHIWARAADGGEGRQTVLEAVDLLQLGDAHGAPRALQQLLAACCTLTQARKLAKAEFEDAGHAGGAALRFDRAVQRRQIITGPEAAFEAVGFAACAADAAPLAEDDGPGTERGQQQQRNDDLHRYARLHDEPEDGERLSHRRQPPRPGRRAGTAA